MFELTTSILVNAPQELAFAVLWDVVRYPEFLTDVVDVTAEPGDSADEQIVHYVVQAPRRLQYALRMRAEAPARIKWALVEDPGQNQAQWQSHNRGSWQFSTTPEGALLTMRVELDFRVPVPDVIMKKLVEFNLPVMMRQVRARIEQTNRSST